MFDLNIKQRRDHKAGRTYGVLVPVFLELNDPANGYHDYLCQLRWNFDRFCRLG